MNILYKKVPASRSVPDYMRNTGNLAPDLEPVGNGRINVINDFPWTFTPGNPSNPATQGRKETPFIILGEFYQKQSSLQQQLRPYGITNGLNSSFKSFLDLVGSGFDTNTDRLYEGIFDISDSNYSGFTYVFPFFSQNNLTLSNSWEKKDLLNTIIDYQKKFMGPAGGLAGRGLAGIIFKLFQKQVKTQGLSDLAGQLPEMIRDVTLLQLQNNNPAVGLLDPPHIFRSSANKQYQITFYLYNTVAPNIPISNLGYDQEVKKTIVKNWELCYMLSYQNSVNKKNFFTGLPPVFYTVIIPGVHFSKASIISNLTISNVGNTRRLVLPIDGGIDVDVNVPDAYKIDITIRDIFMPSKNLYSAINDTESLRVVTEPE